MRSKHRAIRRQRPRPLDDPTDLSGLLWWIKADLGITENPTGHVQTWADQSGNGLDFTQGNVNRKPRLDRSTLNGTQVIDFDGTEYMTQGTISNVAQPGHLFVVARVDDLTNNAPILGGVTAPTLWQLGHVDRGMGDGPQWLISSPNDQEDGVATTGWHVLHGYYSNSTTSEMTADWASVVGPLNCGSNDSTGWMLATKTAASSIGDMAIAEAICVEGEMNDYEVVQVHRYLSTQWGV